VRSPRTKASSALQALLNYEQGGNAALGTYRDKNHPAVVAETFATLLSRSKALPVYLPELREYLLNYPTADSGNIQSEFYWEKVNFGLKPTLRMVQAIVYEGKSPERPAYAVAVKQLYASHYFESALDLTVCVKDNENPAHPGFYLITMKGSQQAGLTGLRWKRPWLPSNRNSSLRRNHRITQGDEYGVPRSSHLECTDDRAAVRVGAGDCVRRPRRHRDFRFLDSVRLPD
jgi:hypothetical protein